MYRRTKGLKLACASNIRWRVPNRVRTMLHSTYDIKRVEIGEGDVFWEESGENWCKL
jgi:hypothetical protein